ncbi:MAG: polysaccharide biosynthesis protein [Bacteroidales bacterium]|nr:polysaccharide biosynthesis protein [Bacteroidales bacterium]
MAFHLDRFIAQNITGRPQSLFSADLVRHSDELKALIAGRKACVIGGAGSIGSAFIKELLRFRPASLVVVDLSENGLAELTRDLHSSDGVTVPPDYRTYALDFADPIFGEIFREEGGFDIVANFSAHKHVRSEKDRHSVRALLQNNDLKARGLLDLLSTCPPSHFFCVSTDKAAGPVNVMGASKRVMEDLIMAYKDRFKVTTARFANVAFSNGSLPDSWMQRLQKRQPLVAPDDVLRYFVSPEEAGQICLFACIMGRSGEIFYPKLRQEQMRTFSEICDRFLEAQGLEKVALGSEEEARRYAAAMPEDSRRWPVFYSPSDTTGEKPYEEFHVAGERVDEGRFASLGVIEESPRRSREEVFDFLRRLETIFADPAFTKAQVVAALEGFLPDFHHAEKGRNLDQKM